MAGTIVARYARTQDQLLAQYATWADQGKPEYIPLWQRPFSILVTCQDGYFVGWSWQSYHISVQGVDGAGDKLRCDWTMKVRKSGQMGALKGGRPDSNTCYAAYEAWVQAGKPVEFVYLAG